jgi:hypothetical protein
MAKLIFTNGTTIKLEEVELPLEIPASVKVVLTYESGITSSPRFTEFSVKNLRKATSHSFTLCYNKLREKILSFSYTTVSSTES